jgi:hypothetical protein
MASEYCIKLQMDLRPHNYPYSGVAADADEVLSISSDSYIDNGVYMAKYPRRS